MNWSHSGSEARLVEVLGAYYEAAGSGPEPDRDAWIARHPDLATELAEFFAGQDRVRAMAAMAGAGEHGGAVPEGIEDYEIVREIARGGMGVVFEALQKGLNRPVAIKMILGGNLASEAEIRRFQIEAEAVAALEHPGIVPIYGVGRHASGPFFSMRLMSGGTLADRLGAFRDDPGASAAVVARIARAVDHAHRRGILHRDLKPSNILLDDDGTAHVADFGLACRVQRDSDLTGTGTLVGSPSYMAPEQAHGRRDAISTATDVYGLGAILYALLTGAPPFRGGSALETMQRVRDDIPEKPSRGNPKVDRDLETICLKCLEKDPARRYATAQALADDLQRWRNGEPITARSAGPIERTWRWCRRKPLHALAAGLVFALGVVSVASLEAVNREQAMRLADYDRAGLFDFWFVQGMIEPMKKLADPELAADPRFDPIRRELLALAVEAHETLASRLGNIPGDLNRRVDLYIHTALLHTAAGDHERAWEAYRAAIVEAERSLADANIRSDQLGQAHGHFGMDLWLHGRTAEATPHLRAALQEFQRCGPRGTTHEDRNFMQHAAWFYLLCPDSSLRDPARALPLARRVAELAIDYEARNGHFLGGLRPQFTLALACFRTGDLEGAQEAVGRSMASRAGGDAYDWFLMALIEARRSNLASARDWLERATLWTRRNRYGDFELHFLRAEAEALIDQLRSGAVASRTYATPSH